MENIIGSLDWVSGHNYDTIYDLFFTTERIIAVILQHPNDTIYEIDVAGMLLGGKLEGGNDRHQKMRVVEKRRQDYKEKAFDDLVGSHRFNFEIPYKTVTSVEISRGLFKSRFKFRISHPSIPKHLIHFTFDKKSFRKLKICLNRFYPQRSKGDKAQRVIKIGYFIPSSLVSQV